ncbi:hypothetical protein [Bacillus sp. AFS037270]|nr:hypothetical protein [Bacillus sp. AFS037270]
MQSLQLQLQTDYVIDYRDEDILAKVMEITNGCDVDAVWMQ